MPCPAFGGGGESGCGLALPRLCTRNTPAECSARGRVSDKEDNTVRSTAAKPKTAVTPVYRCNWNIILILQSGRASCTATGTLSPHSVVARLARLVSFAVLKAAKPSRQRSEILQESRQFDAQCAPKSCASMAWDRSLAVRPASPRKTRYTLIILSGRFNQSKIRIIASYNNNYG